MIRLKTEVCNKGSVDQYCDNEGFCIIPVNRYGDENFFMSAGEVGTHDCEQY